MNTAHTELHCAVCHSQSSANDAPQWYVADPSQAWCGVRLGTPVLTFDRVARQGVDSEERAQRMSEARASRSEAYRLARRQASLSAQEVGCPWLWREELRIPGSRERGFAHLVAWGSEYLGTSCCTHTLKAICFLSLSATWLSLPVRLLLRFPNTCSHVASRLDFTLCRCACSHVASRSDTLCRCACRRRIC